MATLPELTNARIPLDQIHVDANLNSRKSEISAETVKELAQAIKAQGLMHPPTVIVGAQLGPSWKKHPYVLIAGFRRFAALSLALKQTESDFRLAPKTWGIREAFAANLAENLGREDITPYELALRCKEMRDKQGMTGPEIAKAVRAHDPEPGSHKPLTEGHVNNLMRVLDKVDGSLLEHWRAQHPKASIRFMFELAAIDEKRKQIVRWRRACGEDIDDDGNPRVTASGGADGGAGDVEGGTDDGGEPSIKRPTRSRILAALDAVKEAVEKHGLDPDDAEAMTIALEWCAGGMRDDLGEAVKLDNRKKEAAPAAPKTEEEKAAAKAAKAAERLAAKAKEAAEKAAAAKAAAEAAKAGNPGKAEQGAENVASA
jgi:ParB/RepB/Spo0J family partition protein